MSYDVAFFNESFNCRYSPYAVYCRLRRGLAVSGLLPVRRRRVVAAIESVADEVDQLGASIIARLGSAALEISVRDNAVLVDLHNTSGGEVEKIEEVFQSLGLVLFDPQAYNYYGDHQPELFAMDYEEESGDPDPNYWVELNLVQDPSYEISESLIGVQQVSEITYAFYKAPIDDIQADIESSYAWVTADMLTSVGWVAAQHHTCIVLIPHELIMRIADGRNPRMYISGFTAFANDDEVIRYEQWATDFDGKYSAIYSLPEVPKRLKTILSTKYSYRA